MSSAQANTAVCASCGHEAPGGEMTAELKFDWTPTGNMVCRDADACHARWLVAK